VALGWRARARDVRRAGPPPRRARDAELAARAVDGPGRVGQSSVACARGALPDGGGPRDLGRGDEGRGHLEQRANFRIATTHGIRLAAQIIDTSTTPRRHRLPTTQSHPAPLPGHSTVITSICRDVWPTTRWSPVLARAADRRGADSDRDAVSVPSSIWRPRGRDCRASPRRRRIRPGLPRDRLLRDHGTACPPASSTKLRGHRHAFFALPREDKLPRDIRSPARTRLYTGGREALSTANDAPGAARSEGVLPRRARRRGRVRVLHELRGPPALRAERLAGGAGRVRAGRDRLLPGDERLVRTLMRWRARALGGRDVLRRQGRPLHRDDAPQLLFSAGRPPAPGQLRPAPTRITAASHPERRGRAGRAQVRSGTALGRRGHDATRFRREHRRSADALDERPLALHHAPRGEPAGRRRPAGLSIRVLNHPNYDVTIECLASQGPPRHTPGALRRLSQPQVRQNGIRAAPLPG